MPMPDSISFVIEFTGGLESAFDNVQKHTISLPARDKDGRPANLKLLIRWLCQNLIGESGNRDVFVQEDDDGQFVIRPGILVLINDADWELEGEEQYEVQEGDNVMFVSTLHGG